MPPSDLVAPATAQPDGEVEDFQVTILPPVTMQGTVWNDANGNGTVDGGETGLGGWTVSAYEGGNLVASTTSAAEGSASFSRFAA